MTKHLRIAVAVLAFASAAGMAYAATCTEGKLTLNGSTCTVVGGHCSCTN